jgi:hypothetical protein
MEILKDTMQEEEWKSITQQPLIYIKRHVDSLQDALVASWARNFYKGREKVNNKPMTATNFVVYMRIQADMLQHVLKQSGQNSIFVEAKAKAGGPHLGFGKIPCPGRDLKALLDIAKLHPNSVGVVRMNNTYGLRFPQADYVVARSKIDPNWKPAANQPVDVEVTHYYKLEPTPESTDRESLQSFLDQKSIKAVVYNAVSPQAWLLGMEGEASTRIIASRSGIMHLSDYIKGKGKGKGKQNKGSGDLLAGNLKAGPEYGQDGGNTAAQGAASSSASVTSFQEKFTDLETKFQKKLDEVTMSSATQLEAMKLNLERQEKTMKAATDNILNKLQDVATKIYKHRRGG